MKTNSCNWFAAYIYPCGNVCIDRVALPRSRTHGSASLPRLEAMQWNSGPAAAVQNRFSTYVSSASTCALNNLLSWIATGPSGQPKDLSFAFTGNTVVGGQQRVLNWEAKRTSLICWSVETLLTCIWRCQFFLLRLIGPERR